MDPATLDPGVPVTPDLVRAIVELVRALGPWAFVALVLGYMALKRVDVALAHLAQKARTRQRRSARKVPEEPKEPEEPEEPKVPEEPKEPKEP